MIRIPFQTKACLPLALAALSACGGGPQLRESYGPPPRAFDGFPAESMAEVANGQALVIVEATFVGNHKRMLGADLTKYDILPIRLTLGLRGPQMSNAQIRLDSEELNMRLYLGDGSVLVPASAEELQQAAGKQYRDKVRAHSFEAGALREYEIAKEKELFIFFKLALKHPQLRGAQMSFWHGNQPLTVDLTKSLLAFNVMLGNKLEAFSVGIQHK